MTTQLTTSLNQKIMKGWKMHHNSLIELVAQLPDTSGNWRPWDGGWTTLELIHHLAWTPEFFFAQIEKRDMNIPPVPSTLAEARELIKKLTEVTEQKLASYNDTELQKVATININGVNVTEPVEEMFHRLVAHEAHHKGQLFIYARQLGVTNPPFYVDLSVK
ncbi:DinB family protein [Paenibacillus glycanilyticus]|uniref:DinB family protein n=1 Tax=Paenibacillus glycanilyticus TaxID=126569 RepID=UPI00203B5803|nr:DinB family protein [Paenibacillus glycanilyticus]MCM3629894.1 DinB family protein [Paenibacillus glycanilyticus]